MQNTTMSHRLRSGFSFIEIMIALAIVVILSAIGAYSYKGIQDSTRGKAARSSLKVIQNSIEMFNTDTGDYPETLDDLVRRPTNPELAKGWVAPYMKSKKDLKDPWKKNYVYQVTPEGEHPYELYSKGPKGSKGTEAERISVWDL